jgi:CheY-like chemotaxis protein
MAGVGTRERHYFLFYHLTKYNQMINSRLNCILVIDDDEPTNFFTRIILEEYGGIRHIKIMQSAGEALDYLALALQPGADTDNFPYPDLVLLDINMPAMNGWEFLEECKKQDKMSGAKIIMLTTSLFPKDMERARDIPEVTGFENKPLSAEKLDKILQKHFTHTVVPGQSLSSEREQNGQAAA